MVSRSPTAATEAPFNRTHDPAVSVGGGFSFAGPFPDKPRGMPWLTYPREVETMERPSPRWAAGTVESYTRHTNCPVCGEPAWFYRSPYDGRVFFDDLGWPYGCRWRLASPHKTTARDYVLVTEENKACRSKWMRSWSSWPRNRPYAR